MTSESAPDSSASALLAAAPPAAVSFTDLLPPELLALALHGSVWSARAVCTAFRSHVEAGCVELRLNERQGLTAPAVQPPAAATPAPIQLAVVLARLPKLRSFFGNVFPAELPSLPFPALTHLDLRFSHLVQDIAPLAAATALLSLDLCACQGVTSLAPLTACRQLRWLCLQQCSGLVDPPGQAASLSEYPLPAATRAASLAAAVLAPLSSCAALTALDLSHIGDGLVDLRPLAALKALEYLSLQGNARIKHVRYLAGCTALCTLDIYRAHRLLYRISEAQELQRVRPELQVVSGYQTAGVMPPPPPV